MVAVRDRAEALRAGRELGVATDAETYARGKKPAILVAISKPSGTVVLAIDSSEYDGLEIARMCGLLGEPPTAYERALGKTPSKFA